MCVCVCGNSISKLKCTVFLFACNMSLLQYRNFKNYAVCIDLIATALTYTDIL